jgi:thiol:disulfide interchange protein DsbC
LTSVAAKGYTVKRHYIQYLRFLPSIKSHNNTGRIIVNRTVPALLLLFSLLCIPFASATQLDLNKAVKIGSGKTMVIEYTDPDCPYCRKGSEFFRNRGDVTRYIFFSPLPMHPEAKDKARYILSARDKAKAYEEVMAGRLDGKKLDGITPEGIKLQEEHAALSKDATAKGTPTYVIAGRIVIGFDQRKLEAILGK